MKKIISMLLSIIMVSTLCACNDSPKSQEPQPSSNVEYVTGTAENETVYGFKYEGPGSYVMETPAESAFQNVNFNGLWIEMSSGATLEFYDDPSGKAIKVTSADGKRSSTSFGWILDGDYIKFPYRDDIMILVEKKDDNIQLKYNEGTYVQESDYDSSTNVLKLGESAETDGAVFTLNEISFTDEVDPSTLVPSASGGLSTSPDMCFAYLTFHLKNISKTAFNVENALDITIDYDDGYKFEMKGDKFSYLGIPNSTINRKITSGSSSGSLLSLSPLTGEDYIVLIPCADVIPEDTTSALKIFVSIPTSQGHKTFIYKVQ